MLYFSSAMSQTQTEKRTADDRSLPAGQESAGSQESESLNSLLSEWETDSGSQSAAQPRDDFAKTVRGLKPVVDFARSEMDRKASETAQQEVGEALSFVKEAEELKEVGDPVVRGLMEAFALEDKAFAKAFQNRGDNPEAWKQALGRSRDWAVDQIKGLPGMKDRSDIEAAEAAVAGTGNGNAPSEDDLPSTAAMVNMTAREWRQFVMEQEAKAPG